MKIMKKQETFLNELREQSNFLLIVLDACRYDTFNYLLDEDIEGVDSEALNTQGWLKRHWTDCYDITYVSATPRISVDEAGMYEADNHFEKVIPVWEFGWDDDLGTTPPKEVVKSVLKDRKDDKIIVHFVQPHAPHIGCGTIDFGPLGEVGIQDVYKNHKRKDVLLSYLNNVKYVYKYGVEPLLDEFNERTVVISADHGELLGEDGNYGHNGPNHEILRKVPWLEIQN